MKKFILTASAAVLIALGWMLWRLATPTPMANSAGEVMVYCAAGLKPAVEELAKKFEKETGTRVILQYGGSGTLLGNLQVAKKGDVFVSGDEFHINLAKGRDLVRETMFVARMSPVVAVAKGNPKGLQGLTDLLREDVKLALANPEAAAIGTLSRELLGRIGLWESVEARVRLSGVFKPTVNDVANDIRIGAADAGILWNATVVQYPDLEIVATADLQAPPQHVAVGVLSASQSSVEALRFARYLQARDRGQKVFAAHGYDTISGDKWALQPELRILSGAMLRPAVEDAILAFERHEGVRVTRVYNGCGLLVSQMRAGERPDAYFSCDSVFMANVADLFDAPITLSRNPMVIVVPKGNPSQLHRLEDLLRPGLRLGLGHPDKSALGSLTRALLIRRGLQDTLAATGNVRVESATGDFLVNQIRAGSLDAVIVYASNASMVREHLDAVPLEGEGSVAEQPFAVGRASDHAALAGRLIAAIQSPLVRSRFKELGFQWVGPEAELLQGSKSSDGR